MKKHLLILTLTLSFMIQSKAQDNPDFNGFRLRQNTNTNVKVYQSIAGVPELSKYKFWSFDYYFYVVKEVEILIAGSPAVAPVAASAAVPAVAATATTPAIAAIPAVVAKPGLAKVDATSKLFVKIFIPHQDSIINETKMPWTQEFEGFVSKDDFNTFLFIEKTEFDVMKLDHYEKYSHGFVLSALTVPFKIYPKIGERATSLSNSSFSVGTFLGYRLGYLGKLGISLGGVFGIASINQNAANNTSITGTDSESMFAANYGVALVVDVSRKFQIGTVMGRDYGFGDKSTTYIYQNKNWFALSFNFNFLDFGARSKDQ